MIYKLNIFAFRELQETKTLGDAVNQESIGLPSLPPGILGLEIPPEVKSALHVCYSWICKCDILFANNFSVVLKHVMTTAIDNNQFLF